MTPATLAAELAAITPTEPRAPLLKALGHYYNEPSARAVATRMAADLSRYAGATWPTESGALVSPHTPGSRRDLLWRIMRPTGIAPSFRTIYRALGARG